MRELIDEVRGRIAPDSKHSLLTPAGRETLQRYLDGAGRIMVEVHRAADIRQLLRWAQRHDVRIAISGGAEAWKLAPQLAAADVPVFVDPLANLPGNFDQIGASLENAARLQAAGVASPSPETVRTTRARSASWPATRSPTACLGTPAWPG